MLRIALFFAALGYASGSVLYSLIIPFLLTGKDIREMGEDRNPGAANAAALCGLPVGILCAALDILKAAVPVYLAVRAGISEGALLAVIAAAPVLGHMFPLFWHFQGGKAICAMFGSLLGILPLTRMVLLLAIIILVLLPFLHDHATLMVVSLTAFAISTWLFLPQKICALIASEMLALVGSRHMRSFRKELAAHRENSRLTEKKKIWL